ncbi:MAG: hypothetical protein JSR46_09320, partial [Verrucomicrobia bacterium]|nr:hypothetical protein [Verrucomicrobiota bacterium]
MRNKCFSFSLLLLVCMGWATWETEGRARPKVIDPATYPYFRDNPYLTGRMRAIMAPYLLPLDHPAKPILDMIFSQARVTESKKTLENAGFEIIASMKVSFITVARHPALPGLVFKIYLDTEKRRREELHQVEWLIKRCVNAEKIRTFIAKKKINYFTVPDKWLYILPERPVSRELNPQPLIVVETDMQLVSHGDTELA